MELELLIGPLVLLVSAIALLRFDFQPVSMLSAGHKAHWHTLPCRAAPCSPTCFPIPSYLVEGVELNIVINGSLIVMPVSLISDTASLVDH